jgi:hypothetical protein
MAVFDIAEPAPLEPLESGLAELPPGDEALLSLGFEAVESAGLLLQPSTTKDR